MPLGSRTAARSDRYGDLVSLFADWRAFQKPKLVDGVPDYTAPAMAAQHRELARYRQRLAAIDPGGWPVNQQVDWHLVRAEMNGLDFDHRVLRPWAANPAFYVTVFTDQSDQPAREGPLAYGAVELWSYAFPLTPERAGRMDAGLRAIPPLLQQAKKNLVGNARDLWVFGTSSLKQQSADLAALAARVGDGAGSLRTDVSRAKEATDAFAAWLEAQARSKTASSGVGVENYNWYLKHVLHLVPWEEMMLQAGMFDARPRARELIYIMLAERAARALGDLWIHSNELTLEQAAQFASANTPRGWLRLDANTVGAEQHLYLQQPAYGTSYITGKIQVEALLSGRKQQLGDRFTMKGFMDDFDASGLIPVSLLRWELTKKVPDDVARMLEP